MEKLIAVFAVVSIFTSFQGAAGLAPSLEVTPEVVVVREGQNVSVTCRSGKALQYCRIEHNMNLGRSWNLKPGTPASNRVSYFGDGLDKGMCGFTIHRVQRIDNGQYRCTMGFMEGTEEAIGTTNITVAVPPSIPDLAVSPSRDRSGEYKDGDTILASCSIRDGRPVSNLSWFMGDEPITRDMSIPLVSHVVNEDLFSIQQNLTYTLSWQDHGKSLRCIAMHLALDNSSSQSVYQINVLFGPRAERDPVQQFGFSVGEPADVTYTVRANPKPTLSWVIDTQQLSEGQIDSTGHYEVIAARNLGGGAWEAKLHISSVTMEDIERNYILKARNEYGEESYSIVLSTNDEPKVLQLGAAEIVGIIVAIMVLLLAIFLLIFARATGRWCFAGGVSTQQRQRQDPRESSDTESADHGPTQKAKRNKSKFSNIFKKKSDKVGDDTEMTRELERAAVQPPIEELRQQMPKDKDNIVYAELDLKDVTGVRRPQVRAEDEKTEYAEIVHTRPEEERGTQ